MRRNTTAALFSTLLVGFLLSASGTPESRAFRPILLPPSQAFLTPPEVVSVTDVTYPPKTDAEGIVVFDVSLTEKGQAAEVGAVRDIPPLTSAAAAAVQEWKFKPASQQDMPTPSAITVAFVYRPPVSIWTPPPFSPALPNPASSTNAVVPAGILAVAYADYRVNSTDSGAVIVQLALDTTGKLTDIKILRGMGAFNAPVLAAVKDWKFQPAQFQGEAVRSNVVLVFVYAPPVVAAGLVDP